MLESVGEAVAPDEEPPEADFVTAWFLQAFTVLSQARPSGFGPSALVLSEIVAYWRHVGHIGPLAEFVRLMQALDRVFLEHAREQLKANRPGG